MKDSVKAEIRKIVREELSEQQSARREPTGADERAEKAMLAGDWQLAEQQGLGAREALKQRTGVDAAEYDDADELRAAVKEAR